MSSTFHKHQSVPPVIRSYGSNNYKNLEMGGHANTPNVDGSSMSVLVLNMALSLSVAVSPDGNANTAELEQSSRGSIELH